jgi:hypothetical protein
MKSKDPQVAEETRKHVALVFEQEAPIIEQDTQLLCSSLHDSDAYIRRQAAALLTAILLAAPEHSKVDAACFPDLVDASGDPDDTTRNDILLVLAMNPAGPPGSARDVFVRNLDSPNYRTSEVAAAGLLRAGGERKQDNETLVKAKLDNAPDAKQRLNMLYAIGGSGVQSEALLGSSRKFLSDSDPDDLPCASRTSGCVMKLLLRFVPPRFARSFAARNRKWLRYRALTRPRLCPHVCG